MPLFQETSSFAPTSQPTRYRAVDRLAVLSVIFGVLASITFFSWWLALIPLVGIVLGLQARQRILDNPDVLTGLWLAYLGIALSAVLLLGGGVWLLTAGERVVPYGYDPIKYATLQPDPQHPTMPVPETASKMNDKKVFIQGYMQPPRQQTHIKDFILCPTNGTCPFCTPQPKPTEMIRVILEGDLETSYTTHLVGVAGRFRVDRDDPSGIPYAIEATIIK